MELLNNFIAGSWTKSIGTTSFDVVNPANKQIIAKTPLGTSEDVNRAVAGAKEAFKTWRQTPVIDRVQPLFRLKSIMERDFEEIAGIITREHGKTLAESRGSVRRAIQMVETACGVPNLMMGEFQEDIAGGIDSHSVKQPMGVFGGIAPFNFPAMVPFWFWPFAVATGNTFVLKPSERVPLTQMKIMELIQESKFPAGVMNIVHGGKGVVDALCSHPDVEGISFVGSTAVAKHVYRTSTDNLKRVQALGGAKNFMVVLPDAIVKKAVPTALDSIIGCAGERCLAGSVVICVGDDVAKNVESSMVELASKIKVGDGAEDGIQMGPLISEQAKQRVLKMIDKAVEEGAKILLDGRKNVDDLPGFYLRPTVLTHVTQEMEIAQEEVFGPVICLAQAKSLDESIEWINKSSYANTTTLFTTSGAAARKFTYEVNPSMVGINIGVPAPMAFFSFGGSKESFFGDIKVHGRASVEFYTDTKVSIERWVKDSSIW